MKSKPQVNGSVTLNGVVGNIPRELPAQEDRGAAETLAPDADATKNGTQYSAPAMEQATVDLVAIPVPNSLPICAATSAVSPFWPGPSATWNV